LSIILNADYETGPDPEAPPSWTPGDGSAPPMIEDFIRQAEEEIQRGRQGQEMYFIREDNGKVVKTQAEYSRCLRKGIRLRTVDEAAAREALEAEDAAREQRRLKKERRRARKKR
jgi:hypothetical protein